MRFYFNCHYHPHPITPQYCLGLFNVIVNSHLPVLDHLKANDLFSAGIHPQFINNTQEQKKNLEILINHPNCRAVGECGLDKRAPQNNEIQQSVLIDQIKLSLASQKPLIIHNVGRTFEILTLLKQHRFNLPFVFHGFNLNPKIAQTIINYGGFLSMGKSLLYDNSHASKTIKLIPLDKLFLETDNEAIPIEEIYQKASFHLQMDLIHLKRRIDENMHKIFNIK